jgi:hypothetical protein
MKSPIIITVIPFALAALAPAHGFGQPVGSTGAQCACAHREHNESEPQGRVVPTQDAPRYEKDVPLYEIEFESTLAGIVVSVIQLPGVDVRITIGVGEHMMDVFVAPKEWLDGKNYVFRDGERVEVTGARYISQARDTIIAREIRTDSRTMILRDSAGRPLWVSR